MQHFSFSSSYILFTSPSGLNNSSNKSACSTRLLSLIPSCASSSSSLRLGLFFFPSSTLRFYDAAMLDKAGQQKADCRRAWL